MANPFVIKIILSKAAVIQSWDPLLESLQSPWCRFIAYETGPPIIQRHTGEAVQRGDRTTPAHPVSGKERGSNRQSYLEQGKSFRAVTPARRHSALNSRKMFLSRLIKFIFSICLFAIQSNASLISCARLCQDVIDEENEMKLHIYKSQRKPVCRHHFNQEDDYTPKVFFYNQLMCIYEALFLPSKISLWKAN